MPLVYSGSQPDLFLPFSIRDHEAAFESWLSARQAARQVRRDSSAQVYRDMWGSFTAWCAAQNPPASLGRLRQADLQAFQASRPGATELALSPRHALRLLRLIGNVLEHHTAGQGASVSTAARDAIEAQPLVRYADAAENDSLPQCLDAMAVRQLIGFLTSARPHPDLDASALTWQTLRNRVAVSLQLGAGLTPAEVRALKLGSVVTQGSRVQVRPWKLQVAGNGKAPAHEAPLATWAAELLQYWLAVRSRQGILGDWLLPSKASGQPWSKIAHYKSARQVFCEAGLADLDGGSFQLRHTFAVRQLRHGTEPEKVARWLGVTEPKVMLRYARVLDRPAEVV